MGIIITNMLEAMKIALSEFKIEFLRNVLLCVRPCPVDRLFAINLLNYENIWPYCAAVRPGKVIAYIIGFCPMLR